jgi:hypothetical protein
LGIIIYRTYAKKTKMTDYHIEFAHIYADEEFGEEQSKSAEILKKTIEKLNKKKKSFVVSILIDELHPNVKKLNEQNLLLEMQKRNIQVDFIGYESKLIETAEKLIQMIPPSELKFEHFHDPEREVLMLEEPNEKIGLEEEPAKRPTCALLSASWTLCRLGKYKIPNNTI